MLYFPWIGSSVKPRPRQRRSNANPDNNELACQVHRMSAEQFSCVVRRVRKTNVTDFCYRLAFLEGIADRKLLILKWLPPRDSNPDRLLQRQEFFASFLVPQCSLESTESDVSSFLFYRIDKQCLHEIASGEPPGTCRNLGKHNAIWYDSMVRLFCRSVHTA